MHIVVVKRWGLFPHLVLVHPEKCTEKPLGAGKEVRIKIGRKEQQTSERTKRMATRQTKTGGEIEKILSLKKANLGRQSGLVSSELLDSRLKRL